mmetsp:Transcript_175503/g.426826  ORF Transcript_175503/g.426826 Transcript_175503/m.426826 type:complete len:229 (+) Transcript_175503:177-863(+)
MVRCPLQTSDAFLTNATEDWKNHALREFYFYLPDCFASANQDLAGMSGPAEFDALVGEIVEVPRAIGYAPTAEQLFICEAEHLAARAKMFKAIDVSGSGLDFFLQFLRWAPEYIQSKKTREMKPWQGGMGVRSLIQPLFVEDRAALLMVAMASKSRPECKDLYSRFLRCFTDAADAKTEVIEADIEAEGFDKLVDAVVKALHKFGFAPCFASLIQERRSATGRTNRRW